MNRFMGTPYWWIMLAAAVFGAIGLAGCATGGGQAGTIGKEPFGQLPDGRTADIYTLRNKAGAEARISNYGGTVVSLKMPDRSGRFDDVVLGYERLEDYVRYNTFFGCLVGRYANRIANGKFTLNGREYALARNNGPNHLHGGPKGFDKALWEAKAAQSENGPALELTYLSKDGEEGYPGNLTVKAVYTLTDDNALRIDFTATSDQPTLCNLTHHSFFNLAGAGDVLAHEVFINADRFTPVDATLIPTGELQSVAGTPFDFREPTAIGARINEPDEQLKRGNGYDHNWVINKSPDELALMARVSEPRTGRVLEVFSTQPGMQFYTGNFLSGKVTGKGGRVYQRRTGFCLEPQHFPDSPNHPAFPAATLHPGETYRHKIIYRFSVRK